MIRRTMMAIALGAGSIGTGAGVLATVGSNAAGAEPACRLARFEWTSPSVGLYMTPDHNQTYATGLTIQAPAAGEVLEILGVDWVSYDRYPEGTQPTRAEHDQAHEVWGISIGGVPIGGLTTDVPDTIEEGAVNEWFSGLIAGTFAGGSSQGGELVLRHASLYGFTESANSVHPHAVTVNAQYCDVEQPTTTTAAPTTTAPTTTAAAPVPAPADTTTPAPPSTASATTVVDPAGPSSTGPTTTVLASPPLATSPTVPTTTPAGSTSTTIAAAGPTVPATTATTTATPAGSLPETGSSVSGLLVAGAAFVGVGAAFALIRRRLLI